MTGRTDRVNNYRRHKYARGKDLGWCITGSSKFRFCSLWNSESSSCLWECKFKSAATSCTYSCYIF